MQSLTALWRAAGSVEKQRPEEWTRQGGAEFVSYIVAQVGPGAIEVRDGTIWAHWQIAMTYRQEIDVDYRLRTYEVVLGHLDKRGVSLGDFLSEWFGGRNGNG